MRPDQLTLFLLLYGTLFTAQEPTATAKKFYQTRALTGEAPTIDGDLADPAWEQVAWADDFYQFEPDNGKPAAERTAFRILYDDKFLYVAVRCEVADPMDLENRLGRRDDFPGDFIEVNIDSYFDQRTAFSFSVSASGTRGDEFVSNDGNSWDDSWNPIWYGKSKIEDWGYGVEMKIPLSQLRYADAEVQTWGLQVNRRVFQRDQLDCWAFVPQGYNGWVSRFAELRGIEGIRPQRQVELQPYLVAQTERYPAVDENPFLDGVDDGLNAGLDGKFGVTSDLVLDFTINPDFGQVEADPSAVRLDGFQNFFREQRPFFVENRNLFDQQLTNSIASNVAGEFGGDLLFYSRRIGGSPHGFVRSDPQGRFFATQPDNTTILGAAKFSGKTPNGLAVGILESVTQQEFARIQSPDGDDRVVVEPLTNYAVAKVTQDFNGGISNVGGILTGVNRRLDGTGMADQLHESAYSGGAEIIHRWQERTWEFRSQLMFSHVTGTRAAITQTQRNFEHLFGRPDADHLEVDTTLTALTGHSGEAALAYFGNRWRSQASLVWRSPKFEVNDIGFMNNADLIAPNWWLGYRWNNPTKVTRTASWNLNYVGQFDFSGAARNHSFNTNAYAQFHNFWWVSGNIGVNTLDISNNALFGGPALRKPGGWGGGANLGTDTRKKISGDVAINFGEGARDFVNFRLYGLGVRWQPIPALNTRLGVSYNTFRREYQHVQTLGTGETAQYFGAALDQQTLNLTLRVNYAITPDLTIQYYGSPFITRARYADYKRITDPLAFFEDRYVTFPGFFEEVNGTILLNEGNSFYRLDRPDFTFVQFRSNLVARWEYRMGSELFLVWSQGLTTGEDPARAFIPSYLDNAFGGGGRNIFLVKWTYRFLL